MCQVIIHISGVEDDVGALLPTTAVTLMHPGWRHAQETAFAGGKGATKWKRVEHHA